MKLAILALALVLVAACSGGDGDGDRDRVGGELFARTVIEEPTLLVRSPGGLDDLRDAGSSVGPRHDDYESQAVVDALLATFEDGGDDARELQALHQALIPVAVVIAIEAGDGDPDAIAGWRWLGEIDGRLDRAAAFGDYWETADAEAVLAAAEPRLVGLIAEASGVEPSTVDLGVVAEAVRLSLPVVEHVSRDPVVEERRETQVHVAQVTAGLVAAGRVVLPEGTGVETTAGLGRLPLLDGNGEELVVDDTPVTVEDWVESLFSYDLGNAAGESGDQDT